MSWPENDPSLHELRRKWDEGHFRQDVDGVYGVDEAIDEAIVHISIYDDRGPRFHGSGGATVEQVQGFARDIIEYQDRQFGIKTCRICCLTSTNDPCDDCYARFRRASQTISETGICTFCRGRSPSVICVPCTERILRDGLGEGR